MKEHESEEARTEAAVNLSLGLLEPSERARLEEHLRNGCAECEAEVLSFAQVAGALAMSANAVEPPRPFAGAVAAKLWPASPRAGTKAECKPGRMVQHAATALAAAKRKGIWEKSLLHDPRSAPLNTNHQDGPTCRDPSASSPWRRRVPGTGRHGETWRFVIWSR